MLYHLSRAAAILALIGLMFVSGLVRADVGITTGRQGLTYYTFGQNLAEVCQNSLKINVYESAGGIMNVDRVLNDKRAQFTLVPMDALMYTALQDPTVEKKVKMVTPMYTEEIHVAAQSKYVNFSQLAGKRVVIGVEDSGNWVTAMLLQKKTKVVFDSIQSPPVDGIRQVIAGQADAVIIVAGKPIKALAELSAADASKIRLLNVSYPEMETTYRPARIPQGTYPGMVQSVQTYGVKTILATFDFKAQYQGDIKAMVDCIANNIGALQTDPKFHGKWREVDLSDYKSVSWPIHPVAEERLKRLNAKR